MRDLRVDDLIIGGLIAVEGFGNLREVWAKKQFVEGCFLCRSLACSFSRRIVSPTVFLLVIFFPSFEHYDCNINNDDCPHSCRLLLSSSLFLLLLLTSSLSAMLIFVYFKEALFSH